MGVHFFVAVDGGWAEDPDELAAALRADWPEMRIRPAGTTGDIAYDLELDGELGTLHADGRCIAFKRADELVLRLAVWWRPRVPDGTRLAVFDDSSATAVDVPPGVALDELRARVSAADDR
jgi:hypothetical protein